MREKRRISPKLLHIAAAVSAAALLTIGGITAYLKDSDVRRNVITIGSVKTVLDEGGYKDEQTVVPGQIIIKAPKLTNTGKNDAYVFLKVRVPREQVTLLYEDGGQQGKPKEGLNGKQELFRMLVDDAEGTASPNKNVKDALTENANSTSKDIDFVYHAGDTEHPGWILISAKAGTSTVDASGNTEEWDEYVFGYSTKLSPDGETRTLFDKVQLKSMIDSETDGEKQITVTGMSIQTGNLGIDDIKKDGSTENLNQDQLSKVYAIAERKAAQYGS